VGGRVAVEEDPVRPASVRDIGGGVRRGDGEVLRRVRAAQEVAQECGEVSSVCGKCEWSTGSIGGSG
jgi:hypothetical protein